MKQFLTAALIAASFTAIAQKPASLKTGQALEVATQSTTSTTLEMMGQEIKTTATSTMTQIYSVMDVAKGATTLELSNKAVKFNTEGGMGQAISFDSENAEDRKNELGKAIQKNLNNKFIVTVDDRGTVTAVKDHELNVKASDEDEMVQMILSQLNIAMEPPKAGDQVPFKFLQKTTKTGESWSDEKTNDRGVTNITYTVSNTSDKEITTDYKDVSEIKFTQQSMGTETSVNGTAKGNGQIIVDKGTGLTKQTTGTNEVEANVEAQGMIIPMTTKSSSTITIKTL